MIIGITYHFHVYPLFYQITSVSAKIHFGAVRGWPSVALAKHFYEGTMQQFSKNEVLALSSKTCDRCGRRAELDNPEFQEYLSVDRETGLQVMVPHSVTGSGLGWICASTV